MADGAPWRTTEGTQCRCGAIVIVLDSVVANKRNADGIYYNNNHGYNMRGVANKHNRCNQL